MTTKQAKRGAGEKALAARVVAWLESQHYEVYQEVQPGTYSARADIVVDVNGWGWVIETKTSFGLAVIGQAYRWQRDGITRVSVAIPATKQFRADRELGFHLCRRDGIGIIEVDQYGVKEQCEPRFRRQKHTRRERDILAFCHDGHQACAAAGSAEGGYWTPYRNTMDQVRRFLRGRGWTPLKQLLDGIRHHYSTTSCARSCLAKCLQTIEAKKGWVEARRNGRHLEFRFCYRAPRRRPRIDHPMPAPANNRPPDPYNEGGAGGRHQHPRSTTPVAGSPSDALNRGSQPTYGNFRTVGRFPRSQ